MQTTELANPQQKCLSQITRTVAASDKSEVIPELRARFTQVWNDEDLETLMDHMRDDCTFMASIETDVEGSLRVGRADVRKGFPTYGSGI